MRPWSRFWRYLVALVIGLAAMLAVIAEAAPGDEPLPDPVGMRMVLDLIAGIVALAVLPWRRRHPVAIAALTSALMAISAVATGPAALAVVSMATGRRAWRIAPVGVVWMVATIYFDIGWWQNGTDWRLVTVLTLAAYAVCVVIGMYVGARRELVRNLHERAVTAERERALESETARAAERTRIAREMHDVLAHRISLVAMHAGALTYRQDLDREQTVETAEVVQHNARLALTELRQILGVLRSVGDGEEGAVEPPQPTLADLPALLAEARGGGAQVRLEAARLPADQDVLRADPNALELPSATSRTAYRILQEALTNARKHAPGAPVDVTLGGAPGGLLTIDVRNARGGRPDGRPDGRGAGMGLAGLVERAELVGGMLEHGFEPDGTFVVKAWLPWEEEA
ncbi:histidine kinase [Georgenia halophila]|uniref:histidine kinase n=1 Tax=Georgenia halophila TaxID=620889 RepID=A0ABP8LHS2_9MICO